MLNKTKVMNVKNIFFNNDKALERLSNLIYDRYKGMTLTEPIFNNTLCFDGANLRIFENRFEFESNFSPKIHYEITDVIIELIKTSHL